MANLDFCDKHNMVAYLQKSEGSEGFHQIIDFLTTSHIRAELDNLLVQQKEGYANNTNRVSTINPSISAAGQGFDDADDQERIDSSTQDVNTTGLSINTISENINTCSLNINTASPIPNDPSMQCLEVIGIFDDAYDDRKEVGAEADFNNLVTTINVSSIPTTRIHKDHPLKQIIGDLHSTPLTRRMSQQNLEELGLGRHEHDFKESDFEFIAPEEDYTAKPDICTANVLVSTAGAEVSTASPEVKTAAESLVYIRRSASKRKDKGKAIMKEAEPVQKKTKLQLEQ
ncbi:hypothetical protein Tco_0340549 [Tanacetum coccineum]